MGPANISTRYMTCVLRIPFHDHGTTQLDQHRGRFIIDSLESAYASSEEEGEQ